VIERKSQRRLVRITANVDGRDVGSVATEMERRFVALPKPEGYSLAASAEAGRRRLQPILMTTLTTMLGLLPLTLGFGEGADTQASLRKRPSHRPVECRKSGLCATSHFADASSVTRFFSRSRAPAA